MKTLLPAHRSALRVIGLLSAASLGWRAALMTAPGASLTLIPTNAVWRYLVTPKAPASAWRDRTYDDSAWPSGPAQLGFGDGDEATVLFGMGVGTSSNLTAYFRHSFVLTNVASMTNLSLRLLRDDGAVVYLNGLEVRRDNLPPGEVNHFTLASMAVGGTDESTFFGSSIPSGPLMTGTNILAVEVHQNSMVSSDLSFALELTAQTTTSTNVPPSTNFPPVVRLLSPTNGAAFTAPTNIPLVVLAYDPSPAGRVVTVECFAGDSALGIVTNPPGSLITNFFFTWMNAPTGSHVLTAQARDNQGAVSTSLPVTIHVESSAPIITRQPSSLVRPVGQTALFSVNATGAPPLRYQWQFNQQTLPGATNFALVLSNVQPSHAGNYRVVVANPFGVVTSAVATLTVLAPPSLTPVIGSVSPNTAAVGTTVTIVGTNFSANAASNIVFFGAVKATVIRASPSPLTVKVPPGASYAPVSVTVNGRTAWARQPFGVTFPGTGLLNAASFVTAEEDRSTGDGPVHVVAADLDSDGKPDLVVADRFANTLSLFRNVSVPGTLTPQSFGPRIVLDTGLNPTHLIAVDLDGDGHLDLTVVNADENIVTIFRNLGRAGELSAATFAPRFGLITGANPYSVAAGDIDGDGRTDLAIANFSSNTVSILRNLSSPGFLSPSSFAPKIDWPTGSGPHSVAAGDLDEDGKPEVVVGCVGSAVASVFHNRAAPGLFTSASLARVDFPAGGKTVAIGDLDGDGHADLASGSWSGRSLSLLRNTGLSAGISTNSFAPAVALNTGGATHTLALGDLDGDGKPDLAAVTEMPDQLLLYHNGATPGSLTAASFSLRADLAAGRNAVGVTLADFDLDGRLDVAFANHYADTVRIYRNATGSNAVVAAFVQRQLPAIAGPSGVTVQLLAAPAASVSVYAVEDQPPVGWLVSAVSHDGVFDARTGKVKFGPFYDRLSRTLSYRLTPPAGFTGIARLTGTASADGVNFSIRGADRIIVPWPHPADNSPTNWTLAIGEVTAYAAAWRRGQPWPIAPNPIPMDYVTRAASLWRAGECYVMEPAITNPPLWWVSCEASNRTAGALLAAARAPQVSSATRRLPAVFVPGKPLLLVVETAPAPNTGAFAVEEHLPPGWTAALINEGGEWDPAAGAVKWGPFFESAARRLTYEAKPAPGAARLASFGGAASFDGVSLLTSGPAVTRAIGGLICARDPIGGGIRLSVGGEVGQRFLIETSTDLATWTPLTVITLEGTAAELTDPATAESGQRFYRATPAP